MSGTLITSDLIHLYDDLFVQGGFSVRYRADGSLAPVESGYAVSATSEQNDVPADLPFADFAACVESMHARFPEANALGGWVDGDRLYLDPVEIIDDRATAERVGREREQIAIFHIDTQEEIRL